MKSYKEGLGPDVVSDTARALHRRTLIGWLLVLSLPLVFILVFYVYPISRMLMMSLFDPGFTLKHYVHFFKKPAYLQVLIQTFQMSISVTLITLVLGYPVAYLLANGSSRFNKVLMLAVVLPFFTAVLVRTYAWMVILGEKGVLNQALLQLGLISAPLRLLHNLFSVYIGMVHILLPFMVFPMYSVMVGINRDLSRAAENLGANPFQVFLRIFFPLSLPGVGGGCLLVFIIALGFFITPALLGGVSDVMISMFIETQVTYLLNWGFASAIAVLLLAITIGIFAIYNRFFGIDKMMGG